MPFDFSSAYVEEHYRKYFNHYFYTKMGQKIGLILTKPPTPEQLAKESGTRKNLISDETPRELSQVEKELIDEMLQTMQKTGSDFTDTFRVLGTLRLQQDVTAEVI